MRLFLPSTKTTTTTVATSSPLTRPEEAKIKKRTNNKVFPLFCIAANINDFWLARFLILMLLADCCLIFCQNSNRSNKSPPLMVSFHLSQLLARSLSLDDIFIMRSITQEGERVSPLLVLFRGFQWPNRCLHGCKVCWLRCVLLDYAPSRVSFPIQHSVLIVSD